LDYREFFKLKSGFCDNLEVLINKEDGRIHPHFNQLGAATGRMSCSEPNLQNIPLRGEFGKELRRLFIPKKGSFFISADYSQIELRIAAVVSQDKKLMDFLKTGKDVHKLVASEIFQAPEEEISLKQRNIAKSLNFGILYGMGYKSFSETTGISPKEAKKFIEEYFANFFTLKKYRENLIEKVKKQGFTETLFGRKRFLPEINSRDKRLSSQAERMAINTVIQGTGADIIKMAMVSLREDGIIDSDCKLVLQIHDELLFETKKEEIRKRVKEIKLAMENIVKFEVPLVVEIKIGKNWGDLESLRRLEIENYGFPD
jgi:DNA polymerase-1